MVNISNIFKNFKKFFIWSTKNRNVPKIKKQYYTTSLQIFLFPICYLWVNLIYVVIYTRSYVLILVSLIFAYLFKTLPEYSQIILSISLFISASGVIFSEFSVYSSKTHPDWLKVIPERINKL